MRQNRIRNIVIELTSLLDIVMILIFAVMIKNSQLVEASSQEVGELQKENAEMQKELAEFEGISEELANALGKLEEGDLETLLEQLHNAENEVNSYEYMDDIVIVYMAMTQRIPRAFTTSGACSLDEPQPKFFPATMISPFPIFAASSGRRGEKPYCFISSMVFMARYSVGIMMSVSMSSPSTQTFPVNCSILVPLFFF